MIAQFPRIIGHRGVAGHAPENTLASFRRAHDMGIKCVEVDVKLTRNGVPVIFHDDSLDRTTDGKGLIAEQSLTQLKKYDAGKWFGREFTGERIPTLVELIELSKELGLMLNLELKSTPNEVPQTGQATAKIIKALWPRRLPAPVISSFEEEELKAFADVDPKLERALLVHKLPADWFKKARELGVAGFHCDVRYLTRDQIAIIRNAALSVRCFTVNSSTKASQLFHMGVDSVFTDFPDRIV